MFLCVCAVCMEGGGEAAVSHQHAKCCTCGFIQDTEDTINLHFPHEVYSEVRVHMLVPLLCWLTGNAVITRQIRRVIPNFECLIQVYLNLHHCTHAGIGTE